MSESRSIRHRNSGIRNTLRLTLKELKEILRDRRTILTLVGMPLLIYPLLSILFQKFYFSAAGNLEQTSYRFVLEEEFVDNEGNRVGPDELPNGSRRFRDEELVEEFCRRFINPGEYYIFPELEIEEDDRIPAWDRIEQLTDSNYDPLFVRPSERRYFQENSISIRTEESESLERLVESGEVDVGLRVQIGFFRPRGQNRYVPVLEKVKIIQADSGSSARAATYLRKRIDATNLVLAKMQFPFRGSSYDTLKVEGISQPASISMSSLVPLILILMTVTGAVYPAIDLTAGERERGTLEALIAAPVPRFQVLFAKFIGVLTVAMLTAVVNMTGMFSTLALFGLLPILFGDSYFDLWVIFQVFALLILFAGFFSSVLLAVTSFARSFKEAQAYIVPLMLVSITPGIISLTPGLELGGALTVVPLINIVLLAREIMEGTATPTPAIIAVTSTALYGLSALSVAANIFGSDSILYGNQASWRSLVRRPVESSESISVSRAMSVLAIIFPLSFLSIGLVGRVPQWVASYQGVEVEQVAYWVNLVPFVIATLLVFIAVPWFFLWHGRINLLRAMGFCRPHWAAFLAALLIGVCLWPLVGQLVDWTNHLVAGTAGDSEPEWKKTLLEKAQQIVEKWRTVSPVLIVFCFSIVPAIAEEFFFRGVLLRALQPGNRVWLSITLSALAFGVFHTLSLTDLSSQKFLPSFLAGLLLAWLAVKSGSILPGILLHCLNNGILVSLAYYEQSLVEAGWIDSSRSGFPTWVLIAAGVGLLAGIGITGLLSPREKASLPVGKPDQEDP
ncbi:MAG: ABC transporter permease subunit [Planctomycetota bacterium]|nr:ABC transporter permease subunit [Planctomycetota bacterium]